MIHTVLPPSARRVMAASLIGTAVEFYDFYIYATAAALVFGPLFFPSTSPSAQLLAASPRLALRQPFSKSCRPPRGWVRSHCRPGPWQR